MDDSSSLDATPTVIRLMKHQARGLLVAALLRSTVRERFESLVDTTAEDRSAKAGPFEDRPVLARAGSLLLDVADHQDFSNQLANGLMSNFAAVFWVEMSEHLIRGTTCKFKAFGEFRRFSNTLSFIPELLWEKPVLPSIVPESGADYGLDALCRFALEPARTDARLTFKIKYRGSSQSFQDFGAELLRDRLRGILTSLKLPPPFAAGVFSYVVALASYYAWVIAFDAAIQLEPVSVPGVGNFRLAGTAVKRVDFSAEDAFWKLIKVNAETPPHTGEISPPIAA